MDFEELRKQMALMKGLRAEDFGLTAAVSDLIKSNPMLGWKQDDNFLTAMQVARSFDIGIKPDSALFAAIGRVNDTFSGLRGIKLDALALPSWYENSAIREIAESTSLLRERFTQFQGIQEHALHFKQSFESINRLLESLSQQEQSNEIFLLEYDLGDVVPEEKVPGIVLLDETKNIQHIITNIYANNDEIYKLSPRTFEELIAELLRQQGFTVELTKQTRDNGYDIMAISHHRKHFPIKYLVECKRYAPNNAVGVEIVRAFKEVIQTENASQGIIVTTSYFTKDAFKKQNEMPYRLALKDKADIMDWVIDYYRMIATV